MSDLSNCLYQGYTREKPATIRELALNRLERVADQMTDAEFQVWFDDAIKANMPLTLEEIFTIADIQYQHPDEGECNCTPLHCTCKPHDTGEFSD